MQLELYRWTCWEHSELALVVWDPLQRGSARLLVNRALRDAGDADSLQAHTVVDGLLPAREFIEATLRDPEPLRRWY